MVGTYSVSMTDEAILLNQYHCQGDTSAFTKVVRAYGGMVFATARRITSDAALAEDVAQETFVELAIHGRGIKNSIGAWLHRVTMNLAIKAMRKEHRRRQREEHFVSGFQQEPSESAWAEMEPFLDEALSSLPNNIRCVLIEHFVENRTQQEVASRLGLSQSAVSRQILRGLELLRSRLKKQGVFCGAGLASLLATHSTEAAPGSLQAAAKQIAVTSIGTSEAAASTSAGLFVFTSMTTTTKIILSAAAIAMAIAAPIALHQSETPGPKPDIGSSTVNRPVASQPPQNNQSSTPKTVTSVPAKLPPVSDSVQRKVKDFLLRHGHQTIEQAAQEDPEFARMLTEFNEPMSKDPKFEMQMSRAFSMLRSANGGKGGSMTFDRLDSPVGTGMVEAVFSGEPERLKRWLSDMVEGATFETALSPGLTETTDGLKISTDKPSKRSDPKED